MRVTLSSKGDWKKTRAWFEKMQRKEYLKMLNRYGQQGVDALRSMTPVDSGQTASMWSYEVAASGSGAEIKWLNHNFNGGVNIAIILQYGHGLNILIRDTVEVSIVRCTIHDNQR